MTRRGEKAGLFLYPCVLLSGSDFHVLMISFCASVSDLSARLCKEIDGLRIEVLSRSITCQHAVLMFIPAPLVEGHGGSSTAGGREAE